VTTFTLVLLWVLPSIMISVLLGFILGRALGKHERQITLQALVKMLESAETLSNEVDSHNSDLANVGRTVSDISTSAETTQIQQTLLVKISEVIKSNQKLEDDLVCARYTLEHQAQELDRTRREARTDGLSGVANRKDFDSTLKYWLSKAKRHGEQFALLLIDVDHFKWINDTHGHAAGDRVVAGVGKFFRDRLRDTDYVARYGGDEFVILIANVDLETAVRVAEKIRLEGERTNFQCGSYEARIAVTFSLGLATSRVDDSATDLIERADTALYKAKQGGRNQLNWYIEQEKVTTVNAIGDVDGLSPGMNIPAAS
jgi:diguanylate cyclase